MTTQTQTPEERLSKLEGVYEQVNERLRDLGEEMRQGDAALRTDMNSRFNELAQGQEALREEIRQGDAALREEIRQGDAAIREEIRQTALRAETDARFNELARGQDALRSEANTRFNIMLVLIGGVWATMVGGFIALFTML